MKSYALSLEETYEALRTFEVLGIDKKPDISLPACQSVLETLGSSSSASKDLFYALKVNGMLKCEINKEVFEGIVSKLQAAVSSANSLLDFYHSIGSLVLIKALSQSDGRWRYSNNNPESSTLAAGLALEALLEWSHYHLLRLINLWFSIPLILSLPATVLSLTKKDTLKVKVNTVLGSNAPPLTVKLVHVLGSGSKDTSIIENQELKFEPESAEYFLDALPKSVDVGKYIFIFEAFLKLRHETGVEHIFLVGNSEKKFEIILDFLGLVEKFFYLSGKYDIQLTVGDAVMENSFLSAIGSIELDLPEPPEKAPRPPSQPVEPYSRYGPKAEITHIFRAPDKRPPKELSLAFLGLTLLPFVGFLIGLLRLGVNLKNFPSSSVPAIFAILFHFGIAAVLFLYVLFWLKLDLFTTLKAIGFLGAFLMFVGHRILSHLASTSAKLKSA
ncbi:hypothetical protein GH714_027188 [Hevea brasiliensis]|uniref:Dolichyl-diphosphooligosaccharide--protein glycosyltransferase subunit 2 n=1 Tax=Hevea brasiliensis TaxID=3981 RepID=A0A6A6KXM0_HEVBR|nr:hypothetical protein GH714_027188 [Hevea brasiliensis]